MTESRRMRILLQQISTREFLAETGDWTSQPFQAKDFEHILPAVLYAREHLRDSVTIYCAFSDRRYDFTINLRDSGVAEGMEWNLDLKGCNQLTSAAQGVNPPGTISSH